jgi:hypothetical protein
MNYISPVQDVIDILGQVIRLIESGEPDVTWSGYDTVDDVLLDLADHIDRLAKNDLSKRKELEILFAPTGALQELSISSGWGEQFLTLAERFDRAMKRVG